MSIFYFSPCLHKPRHSHAALLIELGYHIAVAADRLGDTIAIAQDTYAHLYLNKQAEVARTLSVHGQGLAPNTHEIHVSDNGESFVLCPVCGEKIILESTKNEICSQNVPTNQKNNGET